MDQFKRNSVIHSTITRQSMDLHLLSSKLSTYQRGTYGYQGLQQSSLNKGNST